MKLAERSGSEPQNRAGYTHKTARQFILEVCGRPTRSSETSARSPLPSEAAEQAHGRAPCVLRTPRLSGSEPSLRPRGSCGSPDSLAPRLAAYLLWLSFFSCACVAQFIHLFRRAPATIPVEDMNLAWDELEGP